MSDEKIHEKHILVTGYGPFLDHKENPSLEVARFMGKVFKDCEGVELPVEFSKLDEALQAIKLSDYSIIYLLGLAGSRDQVTPEKVALNWCYSPGRPDNKGKTFEKGETLCEEEGNALFSSFPVEELTSFFNQKGINSELSFSAGTYVCNATYFKVLKECKGSNTQACFIHLPKDVDCQALAHALAEFSKTLIPE